MKHSNMTLLAGAVFFAQLMIGSAFAAQPAKAQIPAKSSKYSFTTTKTYFAGRCHRGFARDRDRLQSHALEINGWDGNNRCCEVGTIPDSIAYGGPWCGVQSKNGKKFRRAGVLKKRASQCWFRNYNVDGVKVDVQGEEWTCDKTAVPSPAPQACKTQPPAPIDCTILKSIPEVTPQDLPAQCRGEAPSPAPSPGPGSPDKGSPDKGSPDKGSPDKGSPDKGSPDKGSPDNGSPDPGSPDKGSPDQASPSPVPHAADDVLPPNPDN